MMFSSIIKEELLDLEGFQLNLQICGGHCEVRCILDSVTSLQNGADLIWIETEIPTLVKLSNDGRN